MKDIVNIEEAIPYGRTGVEAWDFKLPEIESGTSVAYAKITGEHGERTTGDRARVYFIINGTGEFKIEDQTISVGPKTTVSIKPHTKYNYSRTGNDPLEAVVFMELFDPSNLPGK